MRTNLTFKSVGIDRRQSNSVLLNLNLLLNLPSVLVSAIFLSHVPAPVIAPALQAKAHDLEREMKKDSV